MREVCMDVDMARMKWRVGWIDGQRCSSGVTIIRTSCGRRRQQRSNLRYTVTARAA